MNFSGKVQIVLTPMVIFHIWLLLGKKSNFSRERDWQVEARESETSGQMGNLGKRRTTRGCFCVILGIISSDMKSPILRLSWGFLNFSLKLNSPNISELVYLAVFSISWKAWLILVWVSVCAQLGRKVHTLLCPLWTVSQCRLWRWYLANLSCWKKKRKSCLFEQ